MLTTIEKVILLKEVPFFEGMTLDQLRILANISEEASYEASQRIYAQNEHGDTLYIVVSGLVAIQQPGRRRGSVVRLATLGPKQDFGEMAIFDNAPNSAEAIAIEKADLLMVRQDTLLTLIRHYPDLAISLLKVMSERLRKAQDRIAEKTQARPKELEDLYSKF